MNKIKLNRIEKFQLTNNEKNELKGGKGPILVYVCLCRCCSDSTHSGEESKSNASTNAAIPASSLPCPAES